MGIFTHIGGGVEWGNISIYSGRAMEPGASGLSSGKEGYDEENDRED